MRRFRTPLQLSNLARFATAYKRSESEIERFHAQSISYDDTLPFNPTPFLFPTPDNCIAKERHPPIVHRPRSTPLPTPHSINASTSPSGFSSSMLRFACESRSPRPSDWALAERVSVAIFLSTKRRCIDVEETFAQSDAVSYVLLQSNFILCNYGEQIIV